MHRDCENAISSAQNRAYHRSQAILELPFNTWKRQADSLNDELDELGINRTIWTALNNQSDKAPAGSGRGTATLPGRGREAAKQVDAIQSGIRQSCKANDERKQQLDLEGKAFIIWSGQKKMKDADLWGIRGGSFVQEADSGGGPAPERI